MPSTIRDLTELTAVAVDDYILISDTSDVTNRDKRISKANLINQITGNGTLAFAGAYTLTVPATGTVSLLGTAQSFSALKTFSAGINFGQSSNLALYSVDPWVPILAFGGGSTGISYSVQTGLTVRIGQVTHATCRIVLTNKGSSTGIATIQGLPVAPSQNYVASVYYALATAWVNVIGIASGTDVVLRGNAAAAANNATSLTNVDFANNSELRVSLTYM